MRHWNQLQPGGQGTVAQFDAYYKTLSDIEKEVRSLLLQTIPARPLTHAKPFKKEMYVGRGATVSSSGLYDILLTTPLV
jgi:hypothetical protein